MQTQCFVGIDEVGRGPLAGPVAVGVVLVSSDFAWKSLPGVTDSKALSETKRETIFRLANQLRKDKKLDFTVTQISAKTIDQIGISLAIKRALNSGLVRILKRNQVVDKESLLIRLDGGLSAPAIYPRQETIIKGDSKDKAIGLASVVAKVTRDRYMWRRAKLAAYAPYDFSTHKGYGTKKHRACIAKYGFSPEHRQSYCRNIKIKV